MKVVVEITDYNKDAYMKETLHVPFAIARGKSEWYDTGLKVEPYKELNDRETIENEVWEFTKNIIDLSFQGKDIGSEIYKSPTFKDAKANYEKWKNSHDDFKIGDMVINPYWAVQSKRKGVVIKVFEKASDVVQVMWTDGTSNPVQKDKLIKTGENLSYVKSIIRAMNK